MKAIDLYSGIGGWSLGLQMAGIDVVASFEIWSDANETYRANLGRAPINIDIRKLDILEYFAPGDIDVVVGSPPCTQFSFSNRGGNGDIDEGLLDIVAFLNIVRILKPKYWVMENVPRVASILVRESSAGGRLHHYKELLPEILVVDASDYGVPQVRKRMLAGKFRAELLQTYPKLLVRPNLGDVIKALDANPVVDPIFGTSLEKGSLTDHVQENSLTLEETRRNREAKSYHPVYNAMSFPDRLDRPSRTITAICTRVSRESIVVPHLESGYRRLTIRERATLQSFPINFRFGGTSYTNRTKMVGNAVPPLLTYCVAQAIRGTNSESLRPPHAPSLADGQLKIASVQIPERNGKVLSAVRSFRSAVPGLRFGSGVRFELVNDLSESSVRWLVRFVYGSPKSIRTFTISKARLSQLLEESGLGELSAKALYSIRPVEAFLGVNALESLQDQWTRRQPGPGPYGLIDAIGLMAEQVFLSITAEQRPMTIASVRMMIRDINVKLSEDDLVQVFAGITAMCLFNDASGIKNESEALPGNVSALSPDNESLFDEAGEALAV